MRVVNVAHGEFFMLGAVFAWFVTSFITGHPALGFLAALVVSPLIVGGIAYASERLVLKRLNYDPEATIVATIGLLNLPAFALGALTVIGGVYVAHRHRWFPLSDGALMLSLLVLFFGSNAWR